MTIFISYIIGGLGNNIGILSAIKGGISIHQDSDWDKHYSIFNHLKEYGISQFNRIIALLLGFINKYTF